jgi:2-C-methyl-D-erythritol 4-phosphate cytidylyltransferase/2-C-methyl-D-erythritol 2,4-cyclodiphosphate synthase
MNGVVAAVVVAAGRGFRAGGESPKQYREIGGEPVIRRSLKGLAGHPGVAMVQPVIHPDDIDLFRAAAAGLDVLEPVFGGATRQASVRAGLEALSPRRPDLVLVHDAARPFASAALIARGIAAARACGAAIPALAIADTVKTVDPSGVVTGTIERAQLRLVQTPQAFGFATLLAAHEQARAAGREDFTDDSALVEWAGIKVSTFEGEAANVKLTTADDFARVGATELAALADVRTGSGYDVHAFGPGDHVTLGGVRIPHSQGLSGHSDADVVCEAPRIGPHRDAMRQRIAEIAGIDMGRVAVKATTSEKLGFIGRSEGMAAFATATVRLPWKD